MQKRITQVVVGKNAKAVSRVLGYRVKAGERVTITNLPPNEFSKISKFVYKG